MKKITALAFLLFTTISCFAQVSSTEKYFDTLKVNFNSLIKKIQNEKIKPGTFTYKGGRVEIRYSNKYKTVIGRVIEVSWRVKNEMTESKFTNLKSIIQSCTFHNKMAYQTKAIFRNMQIRQYGDQKISKLKYCQGSRCIEYIKTTPLPYVAIYPRVFIQIPSLD